MAHELYALQRDLDMVITQIYNMEKSYQLLDDIAQVVHVCEIEQLAQGAQMRRIEEKLATQGAQIKRIEDRLDTQGAQIKRIEDRLDTQGAQIKRIEDRLDTQGAQIKRIEDRLSNIEKTLTEVQGFKATLALITKHLGIQ